MMSFIICILHPFFDTLIKSGRMVWEGLVTCMQQGENKYIQNFGWEICGRGDHLGDIGISGKIILWRN
jgi:hypothetical protein